MFFYAIIEEQGLFMSTSIEFTFNRQKAIEAILYLAKKRNSIDKMSLFKFLFFADIEHLNVFGRPIFGGYYVAMPLGPVPSQLCDLLAHENCEDFDIVGYWITANREPNLDWLSQTDIDMLDLVYGKLGNKTPRELSNLSHEHIGWINANKLNTGRKNNRIDFKDLIRNKEHIEELEETSKYIVI